MLRFFRGLKIHPEIKKKLIIIKKRTRTLTLVTGVFRVVDPVSAQTRIYTSSVPSQ